MKFTFLCNTNGMQFITDISRSRRSWVRIVIRPLAGRPGFDARQGKWKDF